MNLGIADKVGIVTGASQGIGKAIALGLAQEGAKVAITARRPGPLAETAEQIREQCRVEVIAFPGDMTDQATVKQFIKSVIDTWGTVHILVNNVGKATKAPFESLAESDWRSAFEANVLSAVYCTQAVLPYMREQRWGRVVNVAAVSAKEPSEGLLASNVAKSGMISLSKSLSKETAADNVLVNAVCPGRITTPQIERLFSEQKRKEIARQHIPMCRFGTATECANAAVFLASEAAAYITGVAIPVDGGITRSLY